jgi:hypothetical protein
MVPFPHVWNIIILIYLVGLYYSVIALVKQKSSFGQEKDSMIFLFSIGGFGLFLYYTGRSHDYTLFGPAFVAICLLIMYADLFFSNFKKYNQKSDFVFLVLICFFIFCAPIDVVYYANDYVRYFQRLSTDFLSVSPTMKNAMFIKSNTLPQERVLILAANQDGFYYGLSGTKSVLDISSGTDIFLKKEVSSIENFLINNKDYKIFIDAIPPYFQSEEMRSILDNNYYVFASSSDGMKLLLPKTQN